MPHRAVIHPGFVGIDVFADADRYSAEGGVMLFNAHVHMSQWGRDFSPELAEVHLAQFRGKTSWITGEPWTPDGWCVSGDDLIRHMDEAGVDRALVMCLAYVPVNAYDPTMGDYIADLVAAHPDRLVGFYSANPLGGEEEADRLRHYVTNGGSQA